MSNSIEVSIRPEVLRAGSPVTLEAKVAGDLGAIMRVVASVPEYGYSETLHHVADNVYRLNTTVPWEAPSGNHSVEVYAQGAQWNTLARTYVNVRVE